jgi:DNA/RNA-binding domain of Phe-tRNA-synthetase-like protein
MKQLLFNIDAEILAKYPEIAIGYLVVDNLPSFNCPAIADNIKVLPTKAIEDYQLNVQNLTAFAPVAAWRRIYLDCDVMPKTFKSSLESLLRRFFQQDYRSINPLVDAYNHVSAGFFISVGGYSIDKIEGKISLRFSQAGDKFIPLNGKEDIQLYPKHIVYADENDEAPVICWMWNQKDCRRTMLTSETSTALFIFDCPYFDLYKNLTEAQETLASYLISSGARIVNSGILKKNNHSTFL